VTRLRECGIVGEGRFEGCVNYNDAAEVCEIRCIEEGSCTDLEVLFCSATQNPIWGCFRECRGIPDFVCSDGTVAPPYGRCDATLQCSDGADEANCPIVGGYKCRNIDQFVPYDMLCDGERDCSDGSDELSDCLPTVTCADGTELLPWFYCNGIVDCSDGVDEPGDCAVSSCPLMP
jgi:Low-density lipoprotein receptor domain class A